MKIILLQAFNRIILLEELVLVADLGRIAIDFLPRVCSSLYTVFYMFFILCLNKVKTVREMLSSKCFTSDIFKSYIRNLS